MTGHMSLWRKNAEPLEVENVSDFDDASTELEVVQDDNAVSEGDGTAVSTRRRSLAALLTEAGIASEDQIHEALEEGERTGEKLGEVVVKRGWASEETLARLLAEQWGLTSVDPGALSLDPLAVSRIDIARATDLGGFPVWFDQQGIVVAVAEPSDERFAAFRELLGNTSFVVVPRSTLQELLESRLFGAEGNGGRPGPVELINGWTGATPPPYDLDAAAEAASTNGATHGEFEDDSVASPDGASSPENWAPVEVTHTSTDVPGSLVERLRSIEADVQALEQALVEARGTVDAKEAELAAMREARDHDLSRMRHLEAELDERGHRLHALREKVADLSLALGD